MTTLKALGAVQPGGKMAAKAATLYVRIHRTCGQQGWSCGLWLYKSRLNSQHDSGQTPPVPQCLLHTFLVILTRF